MRFSMLWASDALVALAPKRSTKRCMRAISLAWRTAILRLALLVGGARRDVLRVGALVLDEVADAGLVGPVEVEDTGDRLVEQVEVVADDEQGAAVGPQEAHQPLLGVDVEVVGRLVEAQHVAAGEQDAGQLDAPPLAAGQHADRVVDAVGADAEAGGQRPRLAVGGVAAVGAEQLLGAGVAGDVALVGALLHGDAQLLDALDLGVDAAPRQDVGDGGAPVEHAGDARVLRQVAEGALADDPPGGRLGLAAEHAEQARLAGAVAADEADLVAGHHGEVGRLDDEPAADLDRESLRLEHRARLRIAVLRKIRRHPWPLKTLEKRVSARAAGRRRSEPAGARPRAVAIIVGEGLAALLAEVQAVLAEQLVGVPVRDAQSTTRTLSWRLASAWIT